MTSNRIAVSIFGYSELSAEQQSTISKRIAGFKDLVLFGTRVDLGSFSDFPNQKYMGSLEFLEVLRTDFDWVVFPMGLRNPGVVPVRSVVLLEAPRDARFLTLAEASTLGLSVEELRSIALRSDLVITTSSGLAELISQNSGKHASFTEVVETLELSSARLDQMLNANAGAAKKAVEFLVMPKFTIVTPSFNQAEFIEDTILSVLSQEYKNFDYYIIDGGSTDGTLEILKKYENSVKWISEKDSGYAEAVNKGFAGVTGDYLMWLPSDDVFVDSKVLGRLAEAAAKTKADVIYGDAFFSDVNSKLLDFYRVQDYAPTALLDWCLICQPSTAFRRELFEKCGGLEAKFKSIADYDLWVRFSDEGAQFHRVGFPVAQYRLHPKSITSKQRLLTYLEIFESHSERKGLIGPSWVRAAVGEMRCTYFGLFPVYNQVGAGENRNSSSWAQSFKAAVKKVIAWEVLLKTKLFQVIVGFVLRRSYRIGVFRDVSHARVSE